MSERLRILIVNHCHPNTPHICGQRAARFADALAKRGHAVALLTESLNRDDVPPNPAVIKAHLKALLEHPDGTAALIATPPVPAPLMQRLRAGTLPPLLRKILIAANYGLRGTVFPDWREGTMRYVSMIAETLQPDICWGIFGNTEALHLARVVSQFAGGRWLIDVKDPWDQFIPEAFQNNLAIRYANAFGLTALSEGHAAQGQRFWPHLARTVVRSGIPEALLHVPHGPDADRPADDPFTVFLVGGLYAEETLTGFLDGLKTFAAKAEDRPIKLVYAGGDTARLDAALKSRDIGIQTELNGYLPLPDLAARLAKADACVYLRKAEVLFHHKVFELLATDRPVIAYPGESAETRGIASDLRAVFLTPETPDALTDALTACYTGAQETRAIDRAELAAYTWDAQAEILETAFREALAR